MEQILWLVIGCLGIILTILSVKIVLIRQSMREIREQFADRLRGETNTLITISGHDRAVRELANDINVQLRKLRGIRQRYEQGDRELREAITNISHDLRTPLTAISGYLQILEDREQDGETLRYLSIIRNRTEHLKQMTEELFRYTILAAKNEEKVYEKVVVNKVLEESIASGYTALTEAGITPEILLPKCPITRRSNGKLLSRIFENIIANAVKYSDGDLQIIMGEDGVITFTNRASGLDVVSAERLFDRFYTVENARKSTGLGLSIAKSLTEELGGTINARYEQERLCIILTFPEQG